MRKNMAMLDAEQTKQLFKEGGKAFALSVGVMDGIIIIIENDVTRIFGIILSNWLFILSTIYSILQILFFIRRELRNKKESNSE